MAHGDYSCCAVCDRKMHYGEDATKETLCASCALDVMEVTGQRIETGDQLIAYIQAHTPQEVGRIEISKCVYTNPVDEALKALTSTSQDNDSHEGKADGT